MNELRCFGTLGQLRGRVIAPKTSLSIKLVSGSPSNYVGVETSVI